MSCTVIQVVNFNPVMADDRWLAILELRHTETRIADLDQLQGRFAGHQNLQVDVVGDEPLANSSAVERVARPSDGCVDIANDDSDVIQSKQLHDLSAPSSSWFALLRAREGCRG